MSSLDLRDDNSGAEKSAASMERKSADSSAKSLGTILALFKAGDDTSNFVALSLLKSILDNRTELREDKQTIAKCWKAIPSKFLSRLLKAKPTEKRTNEEAQSMVGLAVAVIQAFVNLLPREIIEDAEFTSRADELVAAVPSSSPAIVAQIAQILLALNFPSLLFTNVPDATGSASTPSSHLFITMLLVDIKSTIPSLQENLNSPDYSTTSSRIAESFDIISNFIGYLVQSLDNDGDDDEASGVSSHLQLEPSQLLQLRTDISETMSLTIEHLRDRYDASVAGATGLHPSARIESDPSSSTTRTITWHSSVMSMYDDPLTLSELRALSLWLREDDNDALRKEAAGIADVLLWLFSTSKLGLDFCSPVLIALEGVLTVPEGVEAFLREEGWETLTLELQKALKSDESHEAEQGIEIVRVLLAVVESGVTGPSKEDWMGVVAMAVEALQRTPPQEAKHLDLHIAVSQLAVELLSQAPRNMRKRHSTEASTLSRMASAKLGAVDGEREEGLMEIIDGLEGLGIHGSG